MKLINILCGNLLVRNIFDVQGVKINILHIIIIIIININLIILSLAFTE